MPARKMYVATQISTSAPKPARSQRDQWIGPYPVWRTARIMRTRIITRPVSTLYFGPSSVWRKARIITKTITMKTITMIAQPVSFLCTKISETTGEGHHSPHSLHKESKPQAIVSTRISLLVMSGNEHFKKSLCINSRRSGAAAAWTKVNLTRLPRQHVIRDASTSTTANGRHGNDNRGVAPTSIRNCHIQERSSPAGLTTIPREASTYQEGTD